MPPQTTDYGQRTTDLFPTARRRIAAVAGCLLMTSIAGCGGSGVETVPVVGVVTVDGRRPPGPGVIFFQPIEVALGQPQRPATASFDRNGRFAAQSFDPGDGLVPGKYQVSLHCWEVPPNPDGNQPKSFIPMRYLTANSSGLELEVPSGSRRINWPVVLKSE